MPDKTPSFSFSATGIGSVPFQDIDLTCREILEHFPGLPFWPQFVKRTYMENMNVQYSEALPLLEIREGKGTLAIPSTKNMESELVTFYDRFFAQDIEYFSISRDYAPGLYHMLALIEQGALPDGPYIKGQTVGPVTFTAGITDPDEKPILHTPELREAMVRGLAIKALWQVRELTRSGRKTIIFLDEPYLSGFGSAFSPIQRHEVIEILLTVMNYLRENCDTLIGIHCCGNTDWSMIFEAGPDIISFDAFEYMDYFLLYPDDIIQFLKKGGTVAWGIIPTLSYTGKESIDSLFSKLQEGLNRVYQWNIDPQIVSERSIITPACGMGTMTPEQARKVFDLMSGLSQRLQSAE